MNILRRICLVFALCTSTTVMPNFIENIVLPHLSTVMEGISSTSFSLSSLDFNETTRIAIPAFGADIGVNLGGAGAGSILTPFPEGGERISVSFKTVDPAMQGLVDASASMLQGGISDLLRGSGGDLLREILGKDIPFGGDKEVVSFDEDGGGIKKVHWLDRFFDFRVTPGMLYGLKASLLVKHYVEHGYKSDELSLAGYIANLAVLTIRLMRSWQRDSKAKGGMKAVLVDRAPVLAKTLRSIAKTLPVAINPTRNEDFLLDKIETFWRVIVNGDGVRFAEDGSVEGGFGFSVTGFECTNSSDATALNELFQHSLFEDYDKKQGDETFFMKATGFVNQYAQWAQRKLTEAEELPTNDESERKERNKRIAEAKKVITKAKRVREAFTRIVEGNRYRDFGRFDRSLAGQKEHVKKFDVVGGQAFVRLLQGEAALSSDSALPCVVRSGNKILYCSERYGIFDSAYLVSIILFQALWGYLDVINGSGQSKEAAAAVKALQTEQAQAQLYLNDPSNHFIRAYSPALLTRPTADIYSVAGKTLEKKGGEDVLKALFKNAGSLRRKGLLDRAAIDRALMVHIKEKLNLGAVEIPALPAGSSAFAVTITDDELTAKVTANRPAVAEDADTEPAPATDHEKMAAVVQLFKEKALTELSAKIQAALASAPLRKEARKENATAAEVGAWVHAFVVEQELAEAKTHIEALQQNMEQPMKKLRSGITAALTAVHAMDTYKLHGSTFSLEEVSKLASEYRRKVSHSLSVGKKEKVQEIIEQARNAMVQYCNVQVAWRAGMQSFFNDQWGDDKDRFIAEKHQLIRKALDRRTELVTAAGDANVQLEGDVVRDLPVVGEGEALPVVFPDFLQEAHRSEGLSEQFDQVNKYISGLWERVDELGASSVANAAEVIKQLHLDVEEANRELGIAATRDRERLVAVRIYRDSCKKRLSIAQGRKSAQAMMRQSLNAMKEAAVKIADVDNENPESSEASREGMKVLGREIALLKSPHIFGGNALISRIGKMVQTFKVAGPVRDKFNARLEKAKHKAPRVKLVAELITAMTNWLMPGLL